MITRKTRGLRGLEQTAQSNTSIPMMLCIFTPLLLLLLLELLDPSIATKLKPTPT